MCRLSTYSTVRVSMAETAEVPAGTPPSTESGSQGLSSSFSATQTCQRPGSPWVACSNPCGTTPRALRTISPMLRAMVMFGRNPGPNTPPVELKPSSRADRAVDHEQRRGAAGALPAAALRGAVALHGLPRGEHDREVLRPAAGHRRVDGGELDGHAAVEMLQRPDHLLGTTVDGGEELVDQRPGGRHERQAVGPALLVAVLDRRVGGVRVGGGQGVGLRRHEARSRPACVGDGGQDLGQQLLGPLGDRPRGQDGDRVWAVVR